MSQRRAEYPTGAATQSRQESELLKHDAVTSQQLDKAFAAMNDGSARARRRAVITISALAGANAYEPLIAALGDPDLKVRFHAMLGLCNHDEPEAHADAIFDALASHEAGPPEANVANEVVRLTVGPGVLTQLGIAERIAPELARIAQSGDSWRTRRHAAFLARSLRQRLATDANQDLA